MSHKSTNLLQILILVCFFENFASVEVCNSYWDFYKPFSKNCWRLNYDNLDVAGIAKTWGFEAERHALTLDDGYKITVFHIYKTVTKTTPIVLGHGADFNALSWVTSGNNSLAYFLGNLGYDLWVIGWRGTVGSFGHVQLSKRNLAYWQGFTFHQMAIYDLRDTLDLVYKQTQQKAIYIGHSMGSTNSYIYCSLYPNLCKERLLGIVSLGPVAYMKPIGPVGLVSSEPIWSLVKDFADTYTDGLIVPSTLLKPAFKLASQTPFGNILLTILLDFMQGPDLTDIDSTITPIFYSKLPGDVAAHLWSHYVQIIDSGRFRQYDYGSEKNKIIYQSEEPPDYPLEKISVPVAMYVGNADWIAQDSEARKTYMEIPKSSHCGYSMISDPSYNHFDFYVAKENRRLLFLPLVEKFKQMEQGECIE